MVQTRGDTGISQDKYIMLEDLGNKNTDKSYSGHAYSREDKHTDQTATGRENIRAKHDRLYELTPQTCSNNNRTSDLTNAFNNHNHDGRVGSVCIKHLFTESAYAAQPLIVVQGPYIRWSLRWHTYVHHTYESAVQQGHMVPNKTKQLGHADMQHHTNTHDIYPHPFGSNNRCKNQTSANTRDNKPNFGNRGSGLHHGQI
eukprot:14037075-Heterocapsa_arctica.AAC.1